jgi:hypothetical protein
VNGPLSCLILSDNWDTARCEVPRFFGTLNLEGTYPSEQAHSPVSPVPNKDPASPEAGSFFGVPSMNDSLEVEVLYPA